MKNLWIAIAVIVVVALLGFGGYKMMNKQNAAPSPTSVAMTHTTTTPEASPSAMAMENSVYKTMKKGTLGDVMTDAKGMTLYIYDKDTTGVSNCSGQCLVNWPAYVATSETGSFPTDITVVKRTDGTLQYAWKGMPLYYFIKDKDSGDAYGDMVGNVWHVVKAM